MKRLKHTMYEDVHTGEIVADSWQEIEETLVPARIRNAEDQAKNTAPEEPLEVPSMNFAEDKKEATLNRLETGAHNHIEPGREEPLEVPTMTFGSKPDYQGAGAEVADPEEGNLLPLPNFNWRKDED